MEAFWRVGPRVELRRLDRSLKANVLLRVLVTNLDRSDRALPQLELAELVESGLRRLNGGFIRLMTPPDNGGWIGNIQQETTIVIESYLPGSLDAAARTGLLRFLETFGYAANQRELLIGVGSTAHRLHLAEDRLRTAAAWRELSKCKDDWRGRPGPDQRAS